MSINQCRIIHLPKIHNRKGNLTFVEARRHIPFSIKRIYYLYDVPGGAERGGHAHKHLKEFLVAMSGSFDVVINDGKQKKRFHLNRSHFGLYIGSMIWRELENFSSGAVCVAIASDYYKESDYYRRYKSYIQAVSKGRKKR